MMVMPRMEDPLLTPRAASVTTVFPGADAERVESLVTEKLEDELDEIQEIKEVRSTSRAGISFLQIELRDDVYAGEAPAIWSRIRDKVDDAAVLMPEGAFEPEFDEIDVKAYALITTLRWDIDSPPSYAILRRLSKQLEDRIATVAGTEKSELYGDPGEEIVVTLNQQSAVSMNLTAEQIAGQLQASDAKVSAGQMRNASGDLLLEVSGEMDTLTRIGKTPVQFGSEGNFVELSDIATIEKTIPDPPSSLALIHDQAAVALGVLVRSDARIDTWTQAVIPVVEQFRSELPQGITLDVIFQQNNYVAQRLSTLVWNLLLGSLAVVAVIFVMMGWRSALIVGSALPLSSLMVLTGMRALEIPIHQMSVTGLIIALGLLIDNAIVVVDEITQKLKEGYTPADAVTKCVQHLAVPLLGSTLTTALAFGPIALMPGPAGEFVGSIAISVILAVLSSLLLALTVVPAFAAIGIRVSEDSTQRVWWQEGVSSSGLTSWYSNLLDFLFAKPVLGVAVCLIFPVLGFIAAFNLSEQFFPPADRDQLQVELELPANASMSDTISVARQIRQEMMKEPTVTEVHWFFGESAPVFYYNVIPNRKNQPRYAQALVQRTTAENGEALIRRLQQKLDERFPQSLPLVRQLEQGPPFYAPVEVRLFGPDVQQLRDLGDQVRLILTQTPRVVHTRSELAEPLPKVTFAVDEQKARLAKLNHAAIANQLNQTLEGATGGTILESTEELPIRVRVEGTQRSNLNRIASLDLLPSGELGVFQGDNDRYQGVPISAISEMTLDPEIAGIPRFNGRRMNEVQAFISAGVLPAEVLLDFQKRLAESGVQLPPGYSMGYGGEAAKRDDAIGNLMANVFVLLVLMVATLVLSFQSFRMASLIGAVAILSVGLGMGSLWLYGYPFGFMAIVGTMGLMGVAINDSIVVLAAINDDQEAKRGDRVALRNVIVKASRHIISTSLTTMAGFAPLVFGGGGFWPPLAVSVSGGVGGATLLALIFIPSAYLILMCRKVESESEEAAQSETTQQLELPLQPSEEDLVVA